MNTLQTLLTRKPALWDGGMGSSLMAAGLKAGQAPENWNITNPEIISQIHSSFFEAGADVVQTNTFGANRFRLREAKCPYTVEQVNHAAAQAALNARPLGKFIAGDLGPTGLSLPPLGQANEKDIEEAFAEQAIALSKAGVDLLSLETISDLREARAALRGIKKVCDVPVIVSLTFRKTPRGFFTIMGNSAVSSLQTLLDEGASAVGANCTISSTDMVKLAEELRSKINGILLIQPNAGAPHLNTDGSICYPETPEQFADFLKPLMNIGIELIGGCCGTTPAHIKQMAKLRTEKHQ